MKATTEWTPEMASRVASFEIIKKNAAAGQVDTILQVQVWSKLEALQMLAKRLGIDKPAEDDDGRDVPTFVFPPGTRIRIE